MGRVWQGFMHLPVTDHASGHDASAYAIFRAWKTSDIHEIHRAILRPETCEEHNQLMPRREEGDKSKRDGPHV